MMDPQTFLDLIGLCPNIMLTGVLHRTVTLDEDESHALLEKLFQLFFLDRGNRPGKKSRRAVSICTPGTRQLNTGDSYATHMRWLAIKHAIDALLCVPSIAGREPAA
jgi:hypothetical protein